MTPHWYRSYFEDPRVLRLYRARLDPVEARRETAGILELLALPVGGRVLDAPCGWGRHALPLAEAGLRVTGVDIARKPLEEGARSARAAALPVRWVRGDLRALPFARAFDAVVCLGSSLGYFLSEEEDLRVLEGFRRALLPRGRLLLETMHRDSFVAGFQAREEWTDDGAGPIRVRRRFDPRRGVNRERLTWPDGASRVHAMRIRSATEWRGLLARAGLEVHAMFGGWNEEPLHIAAPSLVALAGRAEDATGGRPR